MTNKIYDGMSISERLGKVRVDFHNEKLEKTGYNAFAKFKYFELKDFEKKADELLDKWGLSIVGPNFKRDENGFEWSILEIGTYDTNEVKYQQLPSVEHPKIQDVGALVTYFQRYQYQALMHLIEDDPTDATIGKKEDTTVYATPLQVKTIMDNKDKLIETFKEKGIKTQADIKKLTAKEADEIINSING